MSTSLSNVINCDFFFNTNHKINNSSNQWNNDQHLLSNVVLCLSTGWRCYTALPLRKPSRFWWFLKGVTGVCDQQGVVWDQSRLALLCGHDRIKGVERPRLLVIARETRPRKMYNLITFIDYARPFKGL